MAEEVFNLSEMIEINVKMYLRELYKSNKFDMVLGRITEDGSKETVCMVSKVALFFATGSKLIPCPVEASEEVNEIFFVDVTDAVLLLFQEFIFNWKIRNRSAMKHVCGLLEFAQKNQLTELKEYGLFHLARQDFETAAEHLMVLNSLMRVEALDHTKFKPAVKIVCQEMKQLVKTDAWLQLDQKVVEHIAELPQLNISEEELLDAIVQWGLKQCEGDGSTTRLRAITRGALESIRFMAFDESSFKSRIKGCQLLTSDDALKIESAINSKDPEKLPDCFTKLMLPRGMNVL